MRFEMRAAAGALKGRPAPKKKKDSRRKRPAGPKPVVGERRRVMAVREVQRLERVVARRTVKFEAVGGDLERQRLARARVRLSEALARVP